MKKIMLSLLAVAAFAGCSKNAAESPVMPDALVPITLSAGIQTSSLTKADAGILGPVEGPNFPANTENVFRVTAYTAATPADWTQTTFQNEQVNSDASRALSFEKSQYYPANDDKLYFFAYAPSTDRSVEDKNTPPVVKYELTGQQDIMAAQVLDGISKSSNKQPAFGFSHKLKQVKFKLVKDASFDAGVKVTEIKVTKVNINACLSIDNGTLTFEDSPENGSWITLTPDGGGVEITADGAEVPGCLMFEPGKTFTVVVTAGGVAYPEATVTLSGEKAGEAGVSHEVTLTFKRGGIVPTASITPWTKGEDAGANIQ